MNALKQAIGDGDAEAVFREGFLAGATLPDEELSSDWFPMDPAWPWPSLVQAFALLIDGYEAMDDNGEPLVHALVARAERDPGMIDRLDLRQSRILLFGLQRKYHDSWDRPDRAVVEATLRRIAARVAMKR